MKTKRKLGVWASLLAMLLIVCSFSVSVFAYEAVDNSVQVKSIAVNNDTSVGIGESVELAEGTAEKWIDRLALTGDAAVFRTFYETLVEASDNDGEEDYLIDDVYFANSNEIAVAEVTGTINGTFDDNEALKAAVSAEASAVSAKYAKYIRAVYDAFDRDHPEVFWLTGATQLGYSVSASGIETGATYTLTIYFTLKSDSFDIRAEEYQSADAIKSGIATVDEKASALISAVTGKTDAEKIKYFNEQLIKTNEYNTSKNLSAIAHDARECISALEGRTGTEGPVCEAYARAFKVLCDRSGIPCVLVDGHAKTSPDASGEAHMWNYAAVDNIWYAVDVTWNDPQGGASGAVSGVESDAWLLVGSGTLIREMAFIESHPVTNLVSSGGVAFTNGPTLNESNYGTLELSKETQEALSSLEFGETVTLSALGGNGEGEVTYTVTNITGAAKIDGDKLTATKAGTITVTVHKDGESSEPLTVNVLPATPEVNNVTYTEVTEAGKTLADLRVTIDAKGIDGEALAGAFSWYDENGNPIEESTSVEKNTWYIWKFSSEDENYRTLMMKIMPWCVHEWSATVEKSADGFFATVTAECICPTHEGEHNHAFLECEKQVYTLYCPKDENGNVRNEFYYNKTAKAASVESENGEALVITYEMFNGTEWVAIDSAPEAVGSYRATVSLYGTNASVEFVIKYLETDAAVTVQKVSCTEVKLVAPLGFLIYDAESDSLAEYIIVKAENTNENVAAYALKQAESGYITDSKEIALEFACSGGEATCKELAKCEYCKKGYGTLAPHTPSEDDGDCTTDILCSVCGEVTAEGASAHTGGEATCKAKAKCGVCGKEYGELAAHKDENGDNLCDICSFSMQTSAEQTTTSTEVTTQTTATTGSVAATAQTAVTTAQATTAPETPVKPISGGCGAVSKGAEPMLFGGAVTAILGAAAGGKCFGKKRKRDSEE